MDATHFIGLVLVMTGSSALSWHAAGAVLWLRERSGRTTTARATTVEQRRAE
ncbi:hypothetical protein [Cellulomonas marina]|uniref:Uncharacterized protein n=1 Tax=Cellulomonas marina TaxID=988821 RepID=A0A1I1AFI8_9CELL|nr:hypothetical protein [Cellulomonas marina]GIG29703.1 hypothetical protein Cma02nite_23030 [Cellulomonas marina]SFB36126.1 hypothetical protein SAMN05421867_11750 [Cellulomonas marina]